MLPFVCYGLAKYRGDWWWGSWGYDHLEQNQKTSVGIFFKPSLIVKVLPPLLLVFALVFVLCCFFSTWHASWIRPMAVILSGFSFTLEVTSKDYDNFVGRPFPSRNIKCCSFLFYRSWKKNYSNLSKQHCVLTGKWLKTGTWSRCCQNLLLGIYRRQVFFCCLSWLDLCTFLLLLNLMA